MKSEFSLQKSRDASLKEALKVARSLSVDIDALYLPKSEKRLMPRIRAKYAELGQRIHEFNAYNNTLGE